MLNKLLVLFQISKDADLLSKGGSYVGRRYTETFHSNITRRGRKRKTGSSSFRGHCATRLSLAHLLRMYLLELHQSTEWPLSNGSMSNEVNRTRSQKCCVLLALAKQNHSSHDLSSSLFFCPFHVSATFRVPINRFSCVITVASVTDAAPCQTVTFVPIGADCRYE